MSKPTSSLTTRMARGFAACAPESSAYGLCISRNFDDIKHNVCGKEFDVLKRCFQRSRALQK